VDLSAALKTGNMPCGSFVPKYPRTCEDSKASSKISPEDLINQSSMKRNWKHIDIGSMETVLASGTQTPLPKCLYELDGRLLCNLVTLGPKRDPTVDLWSSLFLDNKSISDLRFHPVLASLPMSILALVLVWSLWREQLRKHRLPGWYEQGDEPSGWTSFSSSVKRRSHM
jgi:hypothetical protein